MAVDAFGRELRPGDLIAIGSSSSKFVSVDVVVDVKPKTVDGTRGLKVIIITEDNVRNHHPDNYKNRYIQAEGMGRWIKDERPLTEIRDENAERLIEASRKIKAQYNIT